MATVHVVLVLSLTPTDLPGQSTMILRKFALIGLLLPIVAYAQHDEHQQHQNTDNQGQHTSSLSADDISGLLEGRGMGMAKQAELNGYPGPLHVLELADALGLTMDQRMETQHLREAMLAEAQPLGAQIVEHERHLDMMFAQQRADQEMVEAVTAEIGLLRAQLRAVHLIAHVGMYGTMTSDQRTLYASLRGYTEPDGQAHSGMLDDEGNHEGVNRENMDHSSMDHGNMEHGDIQPAAPTHNGHQN